MSTQSSRIRVGVSSCLLGREVRYDGGHKHSRYLTEALGPYFEWVPVCPEVELGLGTPREAIHLVDEGRSANGGIRLRGSKSGEDHTERMEQFARQRVEQLRTLDLCGYILKKGSPSCGLHRVKIHTDDKGNARHDGRGLFAGILVESLPDLPVEEEGRLCDPGIRADFIERVFAYHRLKEFFAQAWTVASLIDFHRRHKWQLLAHSEPKYRELGRIVARAKRLAREDCERRYREGFMRAMRCRTSVSRHTNVLQHTAGFFRGKLDASERRRLNSVIEDYRDGIVPLVVPITLMRHLAEGQGITYLTEQVYFDPHPKELSLRNFV